MWLNDRLPVFVAAGDRVQTYNPLDGPLIWQADWGLEFDLRVERGVPPERLLLQVYNAGSARPGIQIDLTEIVATTPHARSVVPFGNGLFAFSGHRDNGTHFEAWIDTAQPIPYMRVFSTGRTSSGISVVSVEEFTGNEPIPAAAFPFPRFEGAIALEPPVPVNLDQMMTKASSDAYLRQGMKVASDRPMMEAILGRTVEWDRLAERDATIGRQLRTVLARHL